MDSTQISLTSRNNPTKQPTKQASQFVEIYSFWYTYKFLIFGAVYTRGQLAGEDLGYFYVNDNFLELLVLFKLVFNKFKDFITKSVYIIC